MLAYLTYMAERLEQMQRLLKATGSIYLHCDDTAGHYLKLLMDSIFGVRQYQNSITWRRAISHNDPRRYGRISDPQLPHPDRRPIGHGAEPNATAGPRQNSPIRRDRADTGPETGLPSAWSEAG